MPTKLPPLNSLRAFASAAKHESFTKAAFELNVTQGAVSKQIAILEDYLGFNLFERRHQKLILSKSAKQYLKSVDSALKLLEQATVKIKKSSDKETLNLSVLPSLSNQWLISRISNFKARYPDYKININIGDSCVSFDKNEDTDFAIRIAKKNSWPNFCVEKLLEEKLFCVASPKLKIKVPIRDVRDLLKYNLLLHTSRPSTWQDFFKSHAIKKVKIEHDGGFQHVFMLVNAAKDGTGISLIADFLIEKELQNGSLIKIMPDSFKSGYSYYLIYPKQKAHLHKVQNFKNWLQNQVG